MQASGHRCCNRLHSHPDVPDIKMAFRSQLAADQTYEIAWEREPQALVASSLSNNETGHADQVAMDIDQGAAAAARIQGCVSLDVRRRLICGSRSSHGTHNSHGD